MGRESHALFAGLFIVILGTTLVLVGIWLGDYGDDYDTYVISTRTAVSGLRPESTVYYRGVEAGKVTAIGFDAKDPRTIRIRTRLTQGLPITTLTFARLRVQPLTGLAHIELDNAEGEADPLPTSDEKPAVIAMQPSLLDQLTGAGPDLLGHTEQLLVRLNAMFSEQNRAHVQQILENVESATKQLTYLEARLEQALAEVPAVSTSTRKTLARIDKLTDDLTHLSRTMGRFTEEAQAVAVAGKRATDNLARNTLPRFDALLDELQSTLQHVESLTSLLKEDPQSLLLGPASAIPGPGEPGFKEPR